MPKTGEPPRPARTAPAGPHKWRDLMAPLRRCAPHLGLNGTDIHFLDVLLSFVPGESLTPDPDGRIIVFAGNAAIARRMGLSGDSTVNRSIRRAEAQGLVRRVMSANGKRFRRLGAEGQVLRAYGVDIAPLAAMTGRLAELAARLAEEAAALEALRLDCIERLALLRDTLPAEDLASYRKCLRRKPCRETLASLRDQLGALASGLPGTDDPGRSGSQCEQHKERIQKNSKRKDRHRTPLDDGAIIRAFPRLTRLLAASETPGNVPATLARTAALLPRTEEEWAGACAAMGPARASVLLGYVFERALEIRHPGAYLASLTQHWQAGDLELADLVHRTAQRSGAPNATA